MADQVEPRFVEYIPDDLEPGTLYISTRFRTASHLCACGCGRKVVTPIKPVKWRFTYDGETVTMSPSVGRWQFPCKSHYCIVKNKIVWARPFSEDEMAAVQRRDARDSRDYYHRRTAPAPAPQEQEQVAPGGTTSTPNPNRGVWAWFRRFIGRA